MKGTVLYGPRDMRFEDRDAPRIVKPTDAIIRISATCVCGSDLWPYRGLQPITGPRRWATSTAASSRRSAARCRSVKPGQFVIGSFATSDNTCPNCRYGYQSSCVHREFMTRAQAPVLRVPLADGTLVPTPDVPPDDLVPSLLATSDVLGTGWFAADAANVKPGSTVVVVGDGAVGLLGVLSAKQMGAERIIAMSRHETRQKLAREFGATDIVAERGDEGVARIKELTKGVGADSVLECVGTQESMMQAIRSTRQGGYVCYVGVPHGVELDGRGTVLRPRPPARRPRAGAPLPARADRPGAEREDRPRQGLRPDAAARAGGRGLPRDGRAPRDQGAAAPVMPVRGESKRTTMGTWSKDELRRIAEADDLHISPFREDGVTYGTPTWIWSVAVGDDLYVRAYNGQNSRWYQAAMRQKAGRITAAGMTKEVTFEPVDGPINDRIDDAYRAKYHGSPYLSPMIGTAPAPRRSRSYRARAMPDHDCKERNTRMGGIL